MLASMSWQYKISQSARYLKCPLTMFQVERCVHSTARVLTLGKEIKASLRSLPDVKQAPPPALFYGISGLIPFTAIPTYMVNIGTYIPELAFTSLAYGAVILSFLGGVRWGSFVSNPEMIKSGWKELGWSVTPALLGWTSLLVNNLTGTLLLISAFSFCMVQDARSYQYPAWYKSMRIILSSLVILSLVATLVTGCVLPYESKHKDGPIASL